MGHSLRVLVFSAYFSPAYRAGGPIRTLDALVTQASVSHRVAVLTSNGDLGADSPLDVPPDRWLQRGAAQIYYASPGWREYLSALRRARASSFDVLYLNSFFGVRYSIIPSLLWRIGWFRGADLLLAPRGEFGRGALSIKRVRKTAWIRLSRVLRVHRGAYWHASTSEERQDVRRAIHAPLNRILVREDETVLSATAAWNRAVDPSSLKFVVIARLSPVKGIDVLLRALASVEGDVALDIIGLEEEASYAEELRQLAQRTGPGVRVAFLGALEHDDVLDRLKTYDAMLHPTHGENFGHAIPEALSRGVPVFCSPHTPWTDVLRTQGGGVVDPNSVDEWIALVHRLRETTPKAWDELRRGASSAFQEWSARASSESVFDLLIRAQES